jgi:UDP-2,3-diacylglucosamine hydrolase
MTAAAARLPLHRRDAPRGWRSIELLSDVHLCEQTPRTFDAWRRQLLDSDADAILMLGDLFEVWVGDDARDGGFERRCVEVMHAASERRVLGFMPGNRDFLVGNAMLTACGAEALADATVLGAFGRAVVLTHGDALCLDDIDYQRFRDQVRSAGWQEDFLARPLFERQRIARAMRDANPAPQAALSPVLWADVDPAAALQLLDAAGSDTLIHGHTHRPGATQLSATSARHVLSDWDFDRSDEPRGDVLRLTAQGLVRHDPLALGGRPR